MGHDYRYGRLSGEMLPKFAEVLVQNHVTNDDVHKKIKRASWESLINSGPLSHPKVVWANKIDTTGHGERGNRSSIQEKKGLEHNINLFIIKTG